MGADEPRELAGHRDARFGPRASASSSWVFSKSPWRRSRSSTSKSRCERSAWSSASSRGRSLGGRCTITAAARSGASRPTQAAGFSRSQPCTHRKAAAALMARHTDANRIARSEKQLRKKAPCPKRPSNKHKRRRKPRLFSRQSCPASAPAGPQPPGHYPAGPGGLGPMRNSMTFSKTSVPGGA